VLVRVLVAFTSLLVLLFALLWGVGKPTAEGLALMADDRREAARVRALPPPETVLLPASPVPLAPVGSGIARNENGTLDLISGATVTVEKRR